ncbi:Beta-ketoacyl synthase [Macrophomina phaseolina MS6]|uniref:Beta-ketoacyl synthase n=1 Tax=Macrophomina phaseolina (strain MS6) TaxID=1126212 RepID=K2R7T2_MACPH|nr:Beta-ketoacyl synthase [Macrophomina phaseolina MS6]
MPSSTLVVFGPQTTWPTPDELAQIRKILLEETDLEPFTDAIRGMDSLWVTLVAADPRLSNVPGLRLLGELRAWLDGEDLAQRTQGPPNTLATPLTTIVHVAQYICNFRGSDKAFGESNAQGFCTGFLTAACIACSRTSAEFGRLAAIALRLAVAVGAYVDLDGASASGSDRAACFAVRRKLSFSLDDLNQILELHTSAYVSVISDSNTATVTVAEPESDRLLSELASNGFSAKPISLAGRFHSSVHETAANRLIELCSGYADLQLPGASELLAPLRSNSDGQVIKAGSLSTIAVKSLLCHPSRWHDTITNAVGELQPDQGHPVTILNIGLADFLPRELHKVPGVTVSHCKLPTEPIYPEHAVAIIGMACRLPGANDISQFWDIINSGTSMLRELPRDRFSPEVLRRQTGGKDAYLGNFISDASGFDHRFFKKSAREAASMDPQQRLVLQVAYEALEAAGYLNLPATAANHADVGCYLGVGAVDYEDNVAAHKPTAFSALGTLRAFISGKISHHFGFTGPSVTYDTACSSSAVALHSACRAVATGECAMALAGGVNVITSPRLYQNLGAASFLSATGECKAFDAAADGYCRGEGAALVVLKKLDAALAAGDDVLAVISGSAVGQSDNSSAITVPHAESQSRMYRQATARAGLAPAQVSYVEAHGTGTPVGDPIECASIRQVFGGPRREQLLAVGSVKANIGHTEAASGAAALVKVVLMLEHATIPRQAAFSTLNPRIPPLQPDRIDVPRASRAWDAAFRAACINNYGAAGSNASLVVTQPPARPRARRPPVAAGLPSYPVFVAAHTPWSLRQRCDAIAQFVRREKGRQDGRALLAATCLRLARTQNHSLPLRFVASASSLDDLEHQLGQFARGDAAPATPARSAAKPVVLAFGGQTGGRATLSREVYDASPVLRRHLDRCRDLVLTAAQRDIYPAVFGQAPAGDVTSLHAALFAIQYASAMAWIECGLPVAAVIGHSFGQLTALCVAGALSLADAVKLVVGRAALIEEAWGPEKGVMLWVEADGSATSKLVSLAEASAAAGCKVEVACYNAADSHVLVGSEASIAAAEQVLARSAASLGVRASKRLLVARGYHSHLLDGITPRLHALAATLAFAPPTIPVETCSEGASWPAVTPALVAEQSRQPVFFADAVARLHDRLGPCHWLEAGCDTPVTAMARRALGPRAAAAHAFYPLRLRGARDALAVLADATAALWHAGLPVQPWFFHGCSPPATARPVHLPPYQFETSRHWLDYSEAFADAAAAAPLEAPAPAAAPVLLSFHGFRDASNKSARFAVDPRSADFIAFVSGHAVLGSSLCPASLYVELAVRAAAQLAAGAGAGAPARGAARPAAVVEPLEILAPLGVAADRKIELLLEQLDGRLAAWRFVLRSRPAGIESVVATHATGVVALPSAPDGGVAADLARYTRLIGARRCGALLEDASAAALQGLPIYKAFARVVDYAACYRGVVKVVGKGDDAAGAVQMPSGGSAVDVAATACNPFLMDSFIQVAGLHVNLLKECPADSVFVCTNIEKIQWKAGFAHGDAAQHAWTVYSQLVLDAGGEKVSDIYVFDRQTGHVVMAMLAVRFKKVLTSSLSKVLSRVNATAEKKGGAEVKAKSWKTTVAAPAPLTKPVPVFDRRRSSTVPDAVKSDVVKMLCDVADADAGTTAMHTTFAELGIDSLMVMEVLAEVRTRFSVDIRLDELQDLTDVGALCRFLSSTTRAGSGDHSSTDCSEDDDASSVSVSDPPTPGVRSIVNPMSTTHPSRSSLTSQLSTLIAEHLDADALKSDTVLADAGLDSLLTMELCGDIDKVFGIKLDASKITSDLTLQGLTDMIMPVLGPSRDQSPPEPGVVSPLSPSRPAPAVAAPDDKTRPAGAEPSNLSIQASECFGRIRTDYDVFAAETKFVDFHTKVYPHQAELVLAYVFEAFRQLGSDLGTIPPGKVVPEPKGVQAKHEKVMQQYWRILEEGGLVERSHGDAIRTSQAPPATPSHELLQDILRAFPQHAAEHNLLATTGPRLADCLTGGADPIHLIFGNRRSKQLLEDVYTHAPMFEAGTKLLGQFLVDLALSQPNDGNSRPLRILELGAGTGGTTKHLLERLSQLDIPFTYVFTDLSPSLVAAAKRKFAAYASSMEFTTLDVEASPPAHQAGQYDAVISTNCIHATKSLVNSTTHIRELLQPRGVLCLVELTRNLFWFDLVFGLLEGWWLFDDGRTHVLAHEDFWRRSLTAAGFKHVDWSDGASTESDQLRVIVACAGAEERRGEDGPGELMETLQFKQVGDTYLYADVYYPAERDPAGKQRLIALMIHGGGHVMLSRKDIRPQQAQLLLAKGFLPVSVDYRLCPETTLLEGPMTDVRDALHWARTALPSLPLCRPDVHPSAASVVAVGWSTGGTLAMSLAWTAPHPPDAILAFYCPTDYHDPFWRQPNVPIGSEAAASAAAAQGLDLLEGVLDEAITAYNVPKGTRAVGGWLCPEDPRSRIALHMNWRGQTLPVLLGGLRKDRRRGEVVDDLPQPSDEAIAAVSPLAQIVAGRYRTPTFLVHPTADDLIPYEQSVRTYEALRAKGVRAGVALVDGVEHLFDLRTRLDGEPKRAVEDGYDFLSSCVRKDAQWI